MTMSKFFKSSAALIPSFRGEPLPIPFVSKMKKIDIVDEPDDDKTEWIKLEFLIDIDKPASGSKYSRKFSIF
jgi:hypothetical protein